MKKGRGGPVPTRAPLTKQVSPGGVSARVGYGYSSHSNRSSASSDVDTSGSSTSSSSTTDIMHFPVVPTAYTPSYDCVLPSNRMETLSFDSYLIAMDTNSDNNYLMQAPHNHNHSLATCDSASFADEWSSAAPMVATNSSATTADVLMSTGWSDSKLSNTSSHTMHIDTHSSGPCAEYIQSSPGSVINMIINPAGPGCMSDTELNSWLHMGRLFSSTSSSQTMLTSTAITEMDEEG
jgi:hypothetical protein